VRVVGVTGGIGSGKSSFVAELAVLGVPVVDADAIARRCVEPGSAALDAIVARFGPAVLRADGSLDRAALAAIVFSDVAARRDLEAITHPCIRTGIDAELAALLGRDPRPAVAVVEHPLLIESGAHERVDVVVVVEAPLEQRIARLTEQRGMTEADARARIAAQVDDATRRSFADHVVVNDGDAAALRPAAERLLAHLTAALPEGGA
jgi:dephospho-CoA kinase